MSWVWFAILGALAISAVHITQKRALRDEHSLEFVTMTTVIRIILFYGLFWTKINWTISNAQLLGLIATAFFAAIAFWLTSKALRRQDLSIVFPIINLDAGLTAIIAFLFLGESLEPKQVVGLLTLVIGTYVLHLSETKSPDLHPIRSMIFPFRELWKRPGGRYAFLGVAAFAFNATLDRRLLTTMSWETYLAYVLPLMMVLYLLFSAARGHTFSMYRHQWKTILPWTILASIFLLLANISNSIAISLVSVGLVVAIKRSSTLIDILVSGKMFHERATIQKAIAGAVMLVGLFLILT